MSTKRHYEALRRTTKRAVLSRKVNTRVAKVFFVCATAIETLPVELRRRMTAALSVWVSP